MTDNRAAFEAFCDLFYTQKRVAAAFAFLVADDYIQHNPNVPDGPQPAIDMLTPKFDGSPDARFEIQRILVDGDLAMVHVRASLPGLPVAAVADIYRFENGRIVEHWDVLQPVPAHAAHDHPMF
ncbi:MULTISPECIES: nuclear transport factor 2 family protein [Microbacterium]|uniref:nuclear transport factor 2 family protein n=1 Tax=Microbacterium TaxID=33882 RepID=UPI002780807E|nr:MULTISPECIES: nuclear transport factor 2 family protein [Microbacterium]MDQ1082142.1 putative SnoaL-like aldol condensation-catalyzing enzyme [Microbacterium sp. SORGH_AS_0344]MDQ1169086.1 putative SnoaL-like aldol condensation-catalyzing enzyme [Microbacterium proteolyticum]